MRKTARENKKCVVDSQSHRGGRDGDLFVRLGYRMHCGFHRDEFNCKSRPFSAEINRLLHETETNGARLSVI